MNRSAFQPQDELVPVINAQGDDPAANNFPVTLQNLVSLNTANANALLDHYGLQRGGDLRAKKRRIAAHIGVRSHHVA